MLATIENIQKYYRTGVVAFSPLTGEEVSANPEDYFYLSPGDVLTDDEGEPMILVTEHTSLIPLEA